MKTIVAALAALAICIALPSAASAKSCSAGYVHAIIGGVQKCLHSGETCSVSERRQYRRYGYRCVDVNGRHRLEPR